MSLRQSAAQITYIDPLAHMLKHLEHKYLNKEIQGVITVVVTNTDTLEVAIGGNLKYAEALGLLEAAKHIVVENYQQV